MEAVAKSRLLTLDDVAERCQLSRRTVERLVAADLLPALKVGHSVRVDPNEFAAWLYGPDPGASSSAPDRVSAPNPSPGQSTSAPRTGQENR